MERSTGIGGVFLRSADPVRTLAWYQKHLGIDPAPDFPGSVIRSSGDEVVWGLFDDSTDYFGPGDQACMINYIVSDLAAMLRQLRAAGIEVDDNEEHSEFGDFGWAVDCDGRRFELWQRPAGSPQAR